MSALVLGLAALLLGQSELRVGAYEVVAVIGYCLFGLGLALYATPSSDSALSNLPEEFAGAGAGIYKMASSLGSVIGSAASLAIFTGMISSAFRLGGLLAIQGIQLPAHRACSWLHLADHSERPRRSVR